MEKNEIELSSPPHTKLPSHQKEIISQPPTHNKGGFITMPFIIGFFLMLKIYYYVLLLWI